MALDKSTVAHIARLARIKLPESSLAPMADELSKILTWIEQLDEVDTDNVEPMTRVTGAALPQRADEVTGAADREALLQNAPAAKDGFFTVPKVIE